MRVAHFSDVHALDLDGVSPWQFVNKRAAGYLNLLWRRREKHSFDIFSALVVDLNRDPPDEVICTGDLTNLSLEPEFNLARRAMDEIRLGPKHVTVVPGNHDVYTRSAKQEGLFGKLFADYFSGDAQGADAFPFVRTRGEVAIVGVSTARPSLPPFADGSIGKQQLAEVERLLAQTQGKFRIVALHHPPLDNRHSFLRGLRDRAALQAVLKRVGCEMVLHGHEHRDLRQQLDGPRGPIPIIGVGSVTYRDSRPDRSARYNVYHIENGRLAQLETRVYDSASNLFSRL